MKIIKNLGIICLLLGLNNCGESVSNSENIKTKSLENKKIKDISDTYIGTWVEDSESYINIEKGSNEDEIFISGIKHINATNNNLKLPFEKIILKRKSSKPNHFSAKLKVVKKILYSKKIQLITEDVVKINLETPKIDDGALSHLTIERGYSQKYENVPGFKSEFFSNDHSKFGYSSFYLEKKITNDEYEKYLNNESLSALKSTVVEPMSEDEEFNNDWDLETTQLILDRNIKARNLNHGILNYFLYSTAKKVVDPLFKLSFESLVANPDFESLVMLSRKRILTQENVDELFNKLLLKVSNNEAPIPMASKLSKAQRAIDFLSIPIMPQLILMVEELLSMNPKLNDIEVAKKALPFMNNRNLGRKRLEKLIQNYSF